MIAPFNGSMHPQSPVSSSLPIGSSAENITTEEEDHLIRSTKKVKNDHDFSIDMAQDPPSSEFDGPIQDTIMSNESEIHQEPVIPESANLKVTPAKVISFKQALISNKEKEVPFSDDVEILNLGEDTSEGSELDNEEEEQDGIPVIHLPKSLLDYARKPWKNALIVKPIGYPIGYKSLCSTGLPGTSKEIFQPLTLAWVLWCLSFIWVQTAPTC